MLAKISPVLKDSLILAGALALVAGGTWAVSQATIEHLLHHDAVATGRVWASYLVKNVEDLDQIAAGQKPSADSQRFFDRVEEVGQVFRYIIYDPQGHVRLVSDDLNEGKDKDKSKDKDDDDDDDEDLAAHNPAAARSIAAGEPLINVEEGQPPTRPPFFAEAYVPVVVAGKTIAIVEVYVDQTEKRNDYHRTFVVSTLALGLLIGLAFGIPAVAWRRRTNEKRIAEDRIRFLAHHDALTGLANRSSLIERMDAKLAHLRRHDDGGLALHVVDIDRFKDVNDALGHDSGDALIVAVAQRLRALAMDDDIVARLGGDEFVIVQTNLADAAAAPGFGQAIIDDLSRPYAINGRDVAITASVGVALAPKDGEDSTLLMKRADLAVNKSKADGRNTVSVFSLEMEADLNERLRLERAIREGLLGDRFELYFQPAVQMPERRVVGFEALLRLRDDRGVPIPPTIFIPIAEQIGLIGPIGTWVLREACKTAKSWPDNLKVAVNLSPAQFAAGDIYATVVAALADSGLEPQRLELEITEGLLLQDSDAVMDQLRKLKDFRIGIVMDDFGTGYSSLGYLWKFPFDKLKIDRTFMQALDADDHENAETIVRTIIDLGQSLNMTVTVEGVENERQIVFVEAGGCDQIQGYYFARPLPASDLAAYIARDLHESLSPKRQAPELACETKATG
ncbi:MAG: EAL domain-containing protein [Roseiarcus sp.]|jgi:diguanylate cyclase (GGDEF)-like protein